MPFQIVRKPMKASLIVWLVFTGMCMAQDQNFTLKQYQWKNRLLLVFAPGNAHALHEQQVKQVADAKEGYLERDLVVISVFPEDAVVTSKGNTYLTTTDIVRLRADFGIQPGDFCVILIGKDGGEKLRRKAVLPAAGLFEVIDAMPMRRSEVKQRD